MVLPFSGEQLLANFALYNQAVWPAQVVLTALAVWVAVGLRSGGRTAARRTDAVLAILWLWMAVAYHAAFFSAIIPAAWLFAGLFAGGAVVFAWSAVRPRPGGAAPSGPRAVAGWLLVAYALLGYPAAALLVGHHYPAVPTFGLPCPTTIFTLGALLLSPARRRLTFAIPLAWAAIGAVAAFRLGMPEDYGLAVAGLLALAFAGRRPPAPVARRAVA